jgi:DNA-3-methyladenine glycosylase II
MNDIIAHLSADRKLKRIIDEIGPLELRPRKQIYLHLCASIMSQQLSTRVADVIYKRFEAIYGNRKPTPQQIIDTPDEQLRAIGLSGAKARYIKNVCEFFVANKLTDQKLHAMDDHEVIELLTQIKGVGRWTVEMILMFALGRENVFAVDDLGIQQAMTRMYAISPENKKQMRLDMEKKARKWEPYRTYACMYLWRFKDKK